jgi:DNA-binding NtrC family response regulator
MNLLLKYSWPGNVRELRTAVEHAIVLGRAKELHVLDLPLTIRKEITTTSFTPKTTTESSLNLEQLSSTLIERALEECNGNRSKAAEKLGISRRTLHRKLAAGKPAAVTSNE